MFYEGFYEIFIDSRAPISLFASFDKKYIFLITYFWLRLKFTAAKPNK